MIYQAIFDITAVASFRRLEDAVAFIRAENDEVQCEMLHLEEVPLIDLYGFPMSARDYPAVYGRCIGEG